MRLSKLEIMILVVFALIVYVLHSYYEKDESLDKCKLLWS